MDTEPKAQPLKVRAVESTMSSRTSLMDLRPAKALPTGFDGTVWQECPTCEGTGQEERFSLAGAILTLGLGGAYLATCANCRGVGHVLGPGCPEEGE